MAVFIEIAKKKKIVEFKWNHKIPQIVKEVLRKNDKDGGLILPHLTAQPQELKQRVLGGLVAKTACFQCSTHRFHLWSGK